MQECPTQEWRIFHDSSAIVEILTLNVRQIEREMDHGTDDNSSVDAVLDFRYACSGTTHACA